MGSEQRHYLLIDATRLSLDERILLLALQGCANREEPRLLAVVDEINDRQWVAQHEKDGLTPQEWAFDDALAPLLPESAGAVLYDPKLFCTVGVAASIAAEHGGILCSPSAAMRLGIRDYLDDLRGRWETELEAYTWARENVFPQCSKQVFCTLPMEDAESFEPCALDLAIARGAFVSSLPINEIEFPREAELCRAMMAELEPGALACGRHTRRDSEAAYVQACAEAGLMQLHMHAETNISFHQHLQAPET